MLKVRLMDITKDSEELIEEIGRVAYDSPCRDARAFIRKYAIGLEHEGMLEHAKATFCASGISRTCSHQLVRHRMASYVQRSQRYCKESNTSFVMPECDTEGQVAIIKAVEENSKAAYSALVQSGMKKEDARFVLPQSIETTIVITMNFSALRHFLKLRISNHAQWEIRALAKEMHRILMLNAPSCFEDLVEGN